MSPSTATPNRAEATAPQVSVDVTRPIFVCGVGRSGTSLLHSMLNAHPAIAFPPETHFFRRYVVKRAAARQGVVELVQALSADVDFLRAGVAPASLFAPDSATFPGPTSRASLVAAFAALLAQVAARQGKPRVGDKDPRSIDHIPALASAFPGGFLLHVVRDPREVLLSRTKADWSKGRPWWQHALLAQDQLRRGRKLGARLFGARYCEVRYEELVAEPERVLRDVAVHVGVEYSPAMLDFAASAATLVDDRERAWKKETLGPLLAGNREKWRDGLAVAQVRFVERISHEAFARLGYVRSSTPPSFGARLGAATCRGVAGAAFTLRRAVEVAR